MRYLNIMNKEKIKLGILINISIDKYVNYSKSHVLDICTKSALVLNSIDTIKNVSRARLLGLILSCDMKWNHHIQSAKAKTSKSLFAILWNIYYAICNIPANQFSELLWIEHKVRRIIGTEPPVQLNVFCDKLCATLASRVLTEVDHPLRELCEAVPHRSLLLRNCTHTIRRPPCRTARRQMSFIRFI